MLYDFSLHERIFMIPIFYIEKISLNELNVINLEFSPVSLSVC